eukprot:10219568-Ditylum_brightwellii.AAC.1
MDGILAVPPPVAEEADAALFPARESELADKVIAADVLFEFFSFLHFSLASSRLADLSAPLTASVTMHLLPHE